MAERFIPPPGPGRPSQYKEEYVERVANLALNGATDAEIADDLDVSIATLYNWRAKHPAFLSALKYGKEQSNERVERSLYLRAVGYEHDAVKVSFDKNGNPIYAPYRELVPPDPGAQKLWLMNRKPEEWKERVEFTRPDDPLSELLAEMRKQAGINDDSGNSGSAQLEPVRSFDEDDAVVRNDDSAH